MFPSGDNPQITSSNTDGDHELAAERRKARGHQNGADEADADQEIRRQQQEAERFGEHKKQGKPRN